MGGGVTEEDEEGVDRWKFFPLSHYNPFIYCSYSSYFNILIPVTKFQIWYMMYLLTAIGLPPGGSSTVHIYTQTLHRTTQLTTLFGRISGIRA